MLLHILCDFDRASSLICGNKMPTRCNRVFIADLIACSICFGHHYAHHQGLKSIIQWFAGCCSILQTGRITLSSVPDQQLEDHSTKYHRQQPLYNTLELLMMGIVVPETCWASNKICNKNLCCIFRHVSSTFFSFFVTFRVWFSWFCIIQVFLFCFCWV